MTAQHTPRPWAVYEEAAIDYRPCTIVAECGSRVATCEGGGPGRAVTKAEERANAHLIAAAPDLLAALKELMGWHDHTGGWEGEAWNVARTAIAKATGSIPQCAHGIDEDDACDRCDAAMHGQEG